jgi:hypothetical protein
MTRVSNPPMNFASFLTEPTTKLHYGVLSLAYPRGQGEAPVWRLRWKPIEVRNPDLVRASAPCLLLNARSSDCPCAANNAFHLNQGKSYSEIATELNRSVSTVRNHVKVLLKKFEVRNRSGLIAKTALHH